MGIYLSFKISTHIDFYWVELSRVGLHGFTRLLPHLFRKMLLILLTKSRTNVLCGRPWWTLQCRALFQRRHFEVMYIWRLEILLVRWNWSEWDVFGIIPGFPAAISAETAERDRSFLFLQMHSWIIFSDYSECLILWLYERHCLNELGHVVFHPCSLIAFFKRGKVMSCIFICGFICVRCGLYCLPCGLQKFRRAHGLVRRCIAGATEDW